MFNKINNAATLTFLKSSSVKTFPSGRRRSELISIDIDKDRNGTVDTTESYYIPFDPEARLNTEANSRKYSSLNGYTQTYLKEWDEGSAAVNGRILLSLAGYLFDIGLSSLKTPAAFGDAIISGFNTKLQSIISSDTATDAEKTAAQSLLDEIADKTSIYANIILEDVKLYSSTSNLPDYYTSILRDQPSAETKLSSPCLDLLNVDLTDSPGQDYIAALSNYYFSGLSFSTSPLTTNGDNYECKTRDQFSRTVQLENGDGSTTSVTQHIVSLCILEKSGANWIIHQPAYLPRIEHGITEDSIVIYGNTTLKGADKTLKVEGFTDIDGDTTIKSNLKVEDNINVGTPVTPATADNGGYIVAKEDITAEHDLIAKNNLKVHEDATIETSLVVGERADSDSTEAGTITAKTHIETPTLNASTEITTPEADITTANIDTANITDTANINIADITTASIETATVTNELKVQKVEADDTDAKITADTAEITGNLTVKKTLIATENLEAGINNLEVNRASIDNLTATCADVEDIYQGNYKVPVIELIESDAFWQLKISRIGTKPQN